jgi:hypothetical protein
MRRKSVVLAALAAALATGSAEASTRSIAPETGNVASTAGSPIVSPAARDMLLNAASEVGAQSSAPSFQVAEEKKKPQFKLFDNGPSFVKTIPKGSK